MCSDSNDSIVCDAKYIAVAIERVVIFTMEFESMHQFIAVCRGPLK